MPKKLYGRSLMIVIVPIVLLQIAIGFVFMERHWTRVTERLSETVVRETGMLIALYERYPDIFSSQLGNEIEEMLGMHISFSKGASLLPSATEPIISLLDRTLKKELSGTITRPFRIDTTGHKRFVRVDILLDGKIMHISVLRSRAYATNSHIFLVWMIFSSLLLLTVSILFLRNQIRPIEKLARAAQAFGMGRKGGNFTPGGATEIRRAGLAFLQMRTRIERHIQQRTIMLASVSHDLRTPLTRFKLQLEMMKKNKETEQYVTSLQKDVLQMETMLEDYLSFSRGAQIERSQSCDMEEILKDVTKGAKQHFGIHVHVEAVGNLTVLVKGEAMKRAITNLIHNACKYGKKINVHAEIKEKILSIIVDDDGPGVSKEDYEAILSPFGRADIARNQDAGGTGLGLSISQDIARNHGGDLHLSQSPLGGLRTKITIPV
ncbi:MAG: ATP-binding protein [Parvibaculales bacterium]